MSINKIIITGTLTAEPDIRYTKDEIPVAHFTVAVAGAKKSEGYQYFECIAWRGLACVVGEYLVKGSLVAVEGSMKQGAPEHKRVKSAATSHIVVENMLMLDKKFMKQAGEVARAGTSDGVPEEVLTPEGKK